MMSTLEILKSPPYDGILLSKAMVDGSDKAGSRSSGKYSAAMTQRLYREGVSKFFRLQKWAKSHEYGGLRCFHLFC